MADEGMADGRFDNSVCDPRRERDEGNIDADEEIRDREASDDCSFDSLNTIRVLVRGAAP